LPSSSPQQWPSPKPAASACNQSGANGHESGHLLAQPQPQPHSTGHNLLAQPAQDPFVLVGSDLDTMVHEIHAELGRELQVLLLVSIFFLVSRPILLPG